MTTPTPSIEQTYSMLIQEETQRQIHATPPISAESAYFNASSSY